jgi:hypothetical protein
MRAGRFAQAERATRDQLADVARLFVLNCGEDASTA